MLQKFYFKFDGEYLYELKIYHIIFDVIQLIAMCPKIATFANLIILNP